MKNIGRILFLIALSLVSVSSLAGNNIDFFTTGAANIHGEEDKKYYYGDGMSSSDVEIKTLDGYKKSLTFDHVWTKVWRNNTSDYFKKVMLRYKVDSWSSWKEYNLTQRSWGSWSSGSQDQTWETDNQKIFVFKQGELDPGEHSLVFVFKGEIGNYQGERWLSNNSQNYQMNFTVAGFKVADVDFGSVKPNTLVSNAYTFNSCGWATCSATISDGNTEMFGFSEDLKTKTLSDITVTNNEGGFTIYFKPSAGTEYSATVTMSGTIQGDDTPVTKTFTIKGAGISGDIVVLLADTAKPKNGLKALLSGYLKSNGCNTISSYGFKYGTSTGSYGDPVVVGTDAIEAGKTFTTTLEGLTAGITYYYVAYAASSTAEKEDLSEEGTFKIPGECIFPDPVNDTIDVTIDNSVTESKCELVFNSISSALTAIKAYAPYYSDGKLNTNVRMTVNTTSTVYSETTEAGVTGGKATNAQCIKIEEFNNTNPTKTLVIQGESRTSRATLQHLILRNSRNITLSNLKIEGRETAYTVESTNYHDNAIDIDNGNSSWKGDIVSAGNIKIEHCYIKSYGFACLHVSGYDGITIEDCDIEAEYSDGLTNADAIQWGSSLKLIHCTNTKVIRNNFRGSHATSTWLQGSNNILLMNNVFWNNNVIAENVAFVRLVCQTGYGDNVSNVGIYYNTFYLANNDNMTNKVDFFRLGSQYDGDEQAYQLNGCVSNYDASTIEFKYNNCYSYDEGVPGRTADNNAFLEDGKLAEFCGTINFNNFWSKYDDNLERTSSLFEIKPCDAAISKYINVEDAVCATASSDPSSLVVKTNALNLGSSVSKDASNQGAASMFSDRLHSGSYRPTSSSSTGTSDASVGSGSITLPVNDNIESASKDIDVSGFNLTANTTVTCALSGTNASNFALSHSSLTTDSDGKLSVKVVTVTFNKPASADTYAATLTFSDAADNRQIALSLAGVYDSSTPIENGWTLGAYQQSGGEKVSIIYWAGGTTGAQNAWDNRNNWRKANGDAVTCVDILTEDLTVVIPASTTDNVISYYPAIPEFNDKERSIEGINAGQGLESVTPVKFASNIQMEYGAALKGVENLYVDNIRRYGEANNAFTADRTEWILVGTVIKPFTDDTQTEVRNIQSGDYYLGGTPQVYMRRIAVDDETCSWDDPFTSLEESVDATEAFSIMIPNRYGKFGLPASIYYRDNTGMIGDGTVPRTFYYNGWFFNENGLPSFTGLKAGQQNILCNTYPANMLAQTAAEANGGTIKAFDRTTTITYEYPGGSREIKLNNFVVVSDATTEIKSQNGFIFTPATGTTFTTDADMFTNSSTKYKSAETEKPSFSLYVGNTSGAGGSVAGVAYDPLKDDEFDGTMDSKYTLPTSMTSIPSVYIMWYDKQLDYVNLPKIDQAIPLGVNVQSKMTLVFTKFKSNDFEKAELEDRETGKSYDLLEGKSLVIELAKGIYEGRFYLNLETKGDTPTFVIEDTEDAKADGIDIISDGSKIAISSTDGVVLKYAVVSDMSGRTDVYTLKNEHYNELRLGVSQGVYTIQVIGDTQSKTSKVILK